MTISEEERRQLYDELAEAIGTDSAGVLMELLPRSPSSELVTRTDMQATTLMLRGEMAELRAELKGEMADLRAELRGDMADLRTELRGEMADLRTELRVDMAGLAEQMAVLRVDVAKWLWTAWASNLAVMLALALLVWRLAG